LACHLILIGDLVALRRSKDFFFSPNANCKASCPALAPAWHFAADRPLGLGIPFPFGNKEFLAPDYYSINNSNSFVNPLLLQQEAIGVQPDSAPFLPDFNFSLPPNVNASVAIQQPFPAPQQLAPAGRIPCTQPGCTRTFTRDSDRIRHNNTVHGARQAVYLCPVAGCPKSQGMGYSRADKVTEHKWKKHADLGYTKRAL
jgi:hypothetical protein